MKKLIYFIFLAAAIFFTVQSASAQTATGDDAVSEVSKVTAGRFNSDVDSFFDVNKWDDFGMKKWFGFLQMGNISGIDAPAWEGGLAIKLSKVYVGVYYNGKFNRGVQSQNIETTNMQTGETTNGYDYVSFTLPPDQGITHDNFFGVLFGFSGHGIKFTVKDNLFTFDAPIYTSSPFPYTTTGGISGITAAGAAGSYLYRSQSITPKIQWGAASDVTLGKYTTRPSAGIALAINFDEETARLTDPDGTAHDIIDYGRNTLTPIINFDSGGINFFAGDWGKLSFGVNEEIDFTINGEGNKGAVKWGNKLSPYAGFEYQPTGFFKLGAELRIPVHFGWNPNTAFYFGVGAKGKEQTAMAGLNNNNIDDYLEGDWTTIKTGFQLGLGFIDEITGKPTLFKQINLNWGIKINLPAFAVIGTVDDVSAPGVVTQEKVNIWYPADYLQEFSIGLTFFITDNVLIDGSFFYNQIPFGRVLISVKH